MKRLRNICTEMALSVLAYNLPQVINILGMLNVSLKQIAICIVDQTGPIKKERDFGTRPV